MWIFPNLPRNVDKIPNSKGPGPRTKKGCDGPGKDQLMIDDYGGGGGYIQTSEFRCEDQCL